MSKRVSWRRWENNREVAGFGQAGRAGLLKVPKRKPNRVCFLVSQMYNGWRSIHMRVTRFTGITNRYIEIAFMEYTVLIDARLRKEQERIGCRPGTLAAMQDVQVFFHESGKP